MLRPNNVWSDGKMEMAVGNILRIGVFFAAIFVLVGGVIYLAQNGQAAPHYRIYHGEPSNLKDISGIVRDTLNFQGKGMIQLCLVLLIATPVARVALSTFAFARQHNMPCVLISCIVLAFLAISLIGGIL